MSTNQVTPKEDVPASASDLLEASRTYEGTIPNSVVRHYLENAGCEMESEELVKLVGLAAQQFVGDVVADAHKLRELRGKASAFAPEDKKKLTLEDLDEALRYQGIDAQRVPYFE